MSFGRRIEHLGACLAQTLSLSTDDSILNRAKRGKIKSQILESRSLSTHHSNYLEPLAFVCTLIDHDGNSIYQLDQVSSWQTILFRTSSQTDMMLALWRTTDTLAFLFLILDLALALALALA